VISGTERPERRNPYEPKPDVMYPDHPDWFNQDQIRHWNNLRSVIEGEGIITKLDAQVISNLAIDLALQENAVKGYGDELIVETAQGNFIQNPYLSIANRASERIFKATSLLGLTPTTRSKVISTNSQSFIADTKAARGF
jgi:P27 family predicted phage terminase small subunit